MRTQITAILTTLAGLFVVTACSTARLGEFHNLRGKGILAVSTGNPYLGANLYLAQEAERSQYLMNFLEERGGPRALELPEDSPSMLLYYPEEKEVYRAHKSSPEMDTRAEWIIRGPMSIERRDFRVLRGLSIDSFREPVFVIYGAKHRFKFDRFSTAHQPVEPYFVPTATPTQTPRPKPRKRAAPQPTPEPTVGIPENFDQQALALSKGNALQDEHGNILHIVRSRSLTLSVLAEWYTGSAVNAERIRSFNGLDTGAHLGLGKTIKIPQALVIQRKLLKE